MELSSRRRRSPRPSLYWWGWFWFAVVVLLFVLGIVQTTLDHPGLWNSWAGVATMALVLLDAAFFLGMMLLRQSRLKSSPTSARRRAYGLAALGTVLTVALVLAHGEFLPLTFACIGMVIFAADGWMSLFPVAALAALYLDEVGLRQPGEVMADVGNILAVVSVTAIIYMMAKLTRQRTELDCLVKDLHEANEKLQAAHDELRRARERDVELATLRERNRLAREMHDSLGHALVLIAIKLEAVQRLQAVDPVRAAAEWEGTKDLVRSTMASLRHSLAGLRLPTLQERPFREALRNLALEVEQTTGITVHVEAAADVDPLGVATQEALYRVAQESLANVVKHAGARAVWVTVACADDEVRLEIADNGIGLSGGADGQGPHFGIGGMRERVEGLDGRLLVTPREGGGTLVRAIIPVKEQMDAGYPHPVG